MAPPNPTHREEEAVRRHDADHQRRTSPCWTDDGTMTTFAVRLPRRPVVARLWGRDPLVRSSDRFEALALVLAVVVALLAVPIAGAIGTVVHDSRRDHYAEQASNRSSVVATVTDIPTFPDGPPIGAITVPATWSVGGIEHTGGLAVPSTANIGDPIEIWVDNDNGAWVPAPTSTTRAAVDAVAAALLIWMVVAGTATTLFIISRAACNRIRFARWQLGLDDLVGHDGHSKRHP
jgi:hypothetical protein